MGSEGAAPPARPRTPSRPRALPPPLVFGSERNQELLLRMHREGVIGVSHTETFRDMIKGGLAVRFRAEDGWKLALDPRHPARDALRDLFAEMSRAPAARARLRRELPPVRPPRRRLQPRRRRCAAAVQHRRPVRNVMALALHGPLLQGELRRAVGFGHLHEESREEAPFGRGGLVRDWYAEHGTGVMLDPDHAVAEPMRRLLVAMERAYPLSAFVPRLPPPEPPDRRP